MIGRSLLIGTVVLLLLGACGQSTPEPNTDDPQYKLGYDAGVDDGRNQVCNEIEEYKDSIADALKEQNICPS